MIKQYGMLNNTTDWMLKGKKITNHLHTRCPACKHLCIVELNCAVNLQQRRQIQQWTTTAKCQIIQKDLDKFTLSSQEDLIKAYPKCFKGIKHFPGTYHITQRECLTSCLCTTKLPYIKEPTESVSSLAY